MLTQTEIENQMRDAGRERMLGMFQRAEEAGRASDAPYANRIYREYVLPLSERIRQQLVKPVAGPGHAHAALLADLDPDAVAFLAVRTALNAILGGAQNHRQLGYSIGRTVHRELVLEQIKAAAPELYHTLSRDFARRMSKDERHRMTVFKMQAEKAGVKLVEWGVGSRDQVGLYLLSELEAIGMLDLGPVMTKAHSHKKEYRSVLLTPAVLSVLDGVKHYMAETMPSYGPCVERPLPWTSMTGGGFHTPEMRSIHSMLVKCSASARPAVRQAQAPIFLRAVNALQDTAWKVNERVLDTVLDMIKLGVNVAEVTRAEPPAKPDRLPWMDAVGPATNQTPEQQAQLKEWKHSMAEWYEQRKVHGNAYGRLYTTTRQASMFRAYPSLHFVYFADSRGRLYPMTYGMNPQGSDLQKAMLHFAEGLPVDSPDAIKWFLVQGANKWGYDKGTMGERMQWVREHADQIKQFAAAPLDHLDWTKADKPLQFLAWCFEYKAWIEEPDFVSHLPISMDGSCNGLQNFSAMLRDEIGGEAVNLTANVKMQDIYQRVADAAMARLRSLVPEPEQAALHARWIKHGIPRALVKRPVMTTPYGITHRSAVKYVITDYLATGAAPEFDRKEWSKAAEVVMGAVWPAIGDVVVKAREAMDWLRKASKVLTQEARQKDDPLVSWTTPSGFPATQAYFEPNVHRIRTQLHGAARIRVLSETDEPDDKRHSQSLAPNFVHSMDAAHLHLVSAAAADAGITALAMIHDDFGTHAANAERFARIIRETFVRMYEEHDPLAELAAQSPDLPPLPSKGTLDITQVLRSEFFFS